MTIKTVNSKFGTFKVDLNGDFYGDFYWEKIENGSYEPDTMNFLSYFVDKNTDFMDVGVANGAMSILSSLLGARVIGYEAMPGICSVAIQNIALNEMQSTVTIKNKAISNQRGGMTLSQTSNPSILSSITFSGNENDGSALEVVSLIDEIEDFHIQSRDLIIKIDIEGAEWKLLNDSKVLEILREHKAVVLLAIHPGFHRPFHKWPLSLSAVSKYFWHIRNIAECYQLFSKIDLLAKILRTNLDSVRSPKRIVALMLGGCHEYILDFR